MKICRTCKQTKDLDEFSFRDKKAKKYNTQCKPCHREYTKSHYEHNKSSYLVRTKINNARYKKRNRDYIWSYLESHPCVDCGESDPIVLEFDHIRDKISEISNMVRNLVPLERLKNEITKCVVRCANCHRRKTAIAQGWWKDKLK